MLSLRDDFFKTFSIHIRYFKSYTTGKMTREDRLITQTTTVMARGKVNVKGKNILVQYAFSVPDRKADPLTGWMGVDIDDDGEIDMDNLSPEAAKADHESVVFRVGSIYFSTKKVDVRGNQIVLRESEAKDYKRAELYLNKDFPDFAFTDFDGKKHRFSEFKGKYVLLDVWGWWCGPCRRELPYIREASRNFQSRNLQVIGLNTDPDYTVESMRKTFADNQMAWMHGQFKSVADFLNDNLRVNSFPTTFLISPEGKILSMSRSERDEPDLRGAELLKTLDGILPKP
jgi:thiol-disulfide isomerase/thioredoxin